MGLFGKKEKPEPTAKSAAPAMSEFDEDIRALLMRDDIQCREDVCEAEFGKAQKLLENPTQDTLKRAYHIIGNLASGFDYVPAILWMGDFAENAQHDDEKAVFWYKKAADMGDGNGARCYADMLMAGKGVQSDMRQAMHYYGIAADNGVPEAAFVLGEFLRASGDRQNAMAAYQQALNGGYAPAKIRIEQMKNGNR